MKKNNVATVMKKAKEEVEVAVQRARDSDSKAKQAKQEARLFKQNLKRLRKSARQAKRAAKELETLATDAEKQLRESRKRLKRLLKKTGKRGKTRIARKKRSSDKRIAAKRRLATDAPSSGRKTLRAAALQQPTNTRQKNRAQRSKVVAKPKREPTPATRVEEKIESHFSDTMRIQSPAESGTAVS